MKEGEDIRGAHSICEEEEIYEGLSAIQGEAMCRVPFGFNGLAVVKLTTEGNCQVESSKSGLFQDSPDTSELQNNRLSFCESARLVTMPCITEPEILVHVNAITDVSIPELGTGLSLISWYCAT